MLARTAHRTVRGVTVALLALLVAIAALTVLTLASPQTARAIDLNPIDDLCRNDQAMYLPAGADNGTSSESNVLERVTASGDAAESDGFAYVWGISDAGWRDPGDGLIFEPFGLSICHDTGAQVMTTIGGVAWELLAIWPARIVGLALDWALSGTLSTILLGIVQEPLGMLQDTVFGTWAPLIIMVSLVGIMWNIARRRGQKGWSDFAWMMTVIVATGLIASPIGVSIATGATQAVGQAATCAATAPMGGCEGGDGSVSGTVIDGLLAQAWGAATLGDLADAPIPERITLNDALKDSTPDIRDNYVVTVPIKAIPAGTGGVVSYADALRWTNAYTMAESTRMAHQEEARCGFRDRLPVIGDVTGKTHGTLDPDELCSYKGLVRAAIYSDLATSHPGAYASATGKAGAALGASLSALFGLLPLLIGVACIAVVGLVAELELVLLVLSAPIVGLGALRSPAVGRRWGSELAGSIVRRFAVGVTLGICLWAVGAITVTMTKLLSGAAGGTGVGAAAISTVAPKILPVAIAVVAALAMAGAVKLLTKLQSILLAGVGLPDSGGGSVEQRSRQVAAMAVGAAAGAVGAPGHALRGAAAGLRRGAASGGVGRAAMGGLAAGRGAGARAGAGGGGLLARAIGGRGGSAARSWDEFELTARVDGQTAAAPAEQDALQGRRPPAVVFPPTGVQDATAATTGSVGPRAGDHEDADAAWAKLAGTVPARAHRAARDDEQAETLERTAAALRDAQETHEQHVRTATERIGLRAEALVRAGMSEQDAEEKAGADVARQADELEKAVNAARGRHEAAVTASELADQTPTRWQSAADRWARSTANLDDAATALGLATEADRAAFATYRQMVRRSSSADATPTPAPAGGQGSPTPGGVPHPHPAPDDTAGRGAWWDVEADRNAARGGV